MRAAQLDYADPSFPVSVVDAPDPVLLGPAWAIVEVRAAGICGSDLHNIYPDGSASRIFGPFVTLPMQLGHEVAGVIVERGPECEFEVGTRVAVDPTIACAARGLPLCPRCAEGAPSACLQLGSRVLTPGFGVGFTNELGAGWSERLAAHPSQLHRVPDTVDDATAALTEPLSVAVHGLLRRPPRDGSPLLVVGAGIIGLAAVAAARAVAPSSAITVLARHDHQAAAAARVGAHHVVRPGADGAAPMAALAELGGGELKGKRDNALIMGGFGAVVDAVGSASSLSLCLRTAGQRGAVHLMGAAGLVEVDVAPLWFKELDVVGTFCHASEDHGGRTAHSFDRALELLAAGAFPASVVVTHRFGLDQVREALDTAQARDRGAIKVLFEPAD